MQDLYSKIRPALFLLSEERARRLALLAIKSRLDKFLIDCAAAENPSMLAQRIWGLDFPNPIGLGAGFDKDAQVFREIRRWGFGHVEVGTVTPLPQPGDTKPRVFRLEEDGAVVNHMGFNSCGLDLIAKRLAAKRGRAGIVGANLGKNRDSTDAGADYEKGMRRLAGLADYFVVNISSPNTPGLRDLQRRAPLENLIRRVLAARHEVGCRAPLLVKIAPDLTMTEREDIAAVALAAGIDGIIIANTTVARPPGLTSRHAGERGGLSGRPLFAMSTELLSDMYRLTKGCLPLIGVGGIASPEDAYAKIRAGASLIQLHTSLIFSGPALVGQIKRGLSLLLKRDGFDHISEAVGDAHRAVSAGTPRARRPGGPVVDASSLREGGSALIGEAVGN